MSWYDSNWQYRKKITIDATKVDADLSDFPVLINETDADLQANAKSDGTDILFTSSDGTTKLSHQIENYDDTDGSMRAWVKMPTLSSSTDTEIYVYYGNAGAADQQNITDVWSNNYAGVWLMNEGEGTTVNDYSGNDNHGTMTNMDAATDWIEHDNGYALDFDGGNQHVYVPDDESLDPSSAGFFVSVFFLDHDPSDRGCVISHDAYRSDSGWRVEHSSTHPLWFWIGDGSAIYSGSTDLLPQDTWHDICVVWDPGEQLVQYTNGEENKSITSPSNYSRSGENLKFGDIAYTSGYGLDGQISQVLISNVARSSDWISTSYNNQDSPSTFYELSAEETGPVPITGGYAELPQVIEAKSKILVRITNNIYADINNQTLYTYKRAGNILILFGEDDDTIAYDLNGKLVDMSESKIGITLDTI